MSGVLFRHEFETRFDLRLPVAPSAQTRLTCGSYRFMISHVPVLPEPCVLAVPWNVFPVKYDRSIIKGSPSSRPEITCEL